MARAESASTSAHSDSIKGLAQAVARPAYRRLLTAEPFLRRAVPVLIVAFLVSIQPAPIGEGTSIAPAMTVIEDAVDEPRVVVEREHVLDVQRGIGHGSSWLARPVQDSAHRDASRFRNIFESLRTLFVGRDFPMGMNYPPMSSLVARFSE